MALVILPPNCQALLEPGQVFFSMGDGFVSDSIALETAREAYDAGLLVATHVGIVLEDGYCAEAAWPEWRVAPLGPRLQGRTPLIWLKTPAGQTPEAAAELCRLARELEGTPYDTWAVTLGFPLSDDDDNGRAPNFAEDPGRLFCSEGVDTLLRRTEHLRTVPLPEAFKAVHPSWRSPQGLNLAPIWA